MPGYVMSERRIERHKHYQIVVTPYEGMYRFRLIPLRGGHDWNPPIDAATPEEAIHKAKQYIDAIPDLDWV